jgi:Carboxypeptidase regulatory-like domain
MNTSQNRRVLQRATAFVVACLLGGAAGVAQTTRGSVAGSIRDAQGAAVPGATVEMISVRRGDSQVTTSNESGDFVVLNLLPDTYRLKVTMDSFKTVERENVVLNAADRLSVGIITLELGALSETVTVTSRVVEVQSRSAERSLAIDSAAISNLAVNGRSPLALTRIVPGIANAPADGSNLGFNVNGSRGGVHNLTVDGVSNMDTGNNGMSGNVNLDAVEEFKILTNAYQAEYGRSSGAQISVVTKSGGRSYHGGAYWYRRHEGMNANSWINNRDRGRALETDPNTRVGLKAINRQSDIGYTIGGPVPLGGYNRDRNRLFFFFAQEHQQRFQPPVDPRRVRVPTELERHGDFSQSLDNNGQLFNFIRDYTTGLPCNASNTSGCFQDGGVLGRIPQNRLYAPGLAILGIYPAPNDSGAGYNFSSQVAQERDRREDIVRIDWQATNKWRMYGRYFNNTNNAGEGLGPYGSFVLGADLPLTTVSDIRPVYNYAFSATGVITPTLFLEVTGGTVRNDIFIHDADTKWNRSALGLSSLPTLFPGAVKDDYPPAFVFGGRSGTNPRFGTNNAPFYNFNQNYDFMTNLTKVWGRHSTKFGFYSQRSHKDQSGFGPNNGQIQFNENSNNPFDTGFSFANAATGVFDFYEQANIWPVGEYRYWNMEWYAQDNWKPSDRLTLDYGIRFYWVQPQYDQAFLTSNFLPGLYSQSDAVRLYQPGRDAAGQRVALDPLTGQTLNAAFIGRLVPNSGDIANGLRTGQDPAVGKYLIEDRGVHYAPRVGLTYDLTGRQDMILRAGGGIFYDRYEGNIAFDQIVNPPNSITPRITWGRLQDVDPANALLAPFNLNAMNYPGEVPTTYNFNLGMQKKLPWQMIWDVAYVGSVQNHLPRRVNLNAVPYGAAFAPQNQDPTLAASTTPGATSLPADFLRPYRGFQNINFRLFDANANYHALQTQVDRRFSNGLFFNVNYTWSKALDTQSGNGDFSRIDEFDKRANYGPANHDRRHIFNLNWVYELPRMQDAGAVLGAFVNDWQLSGGYRYESGAPYGIGWSVAGVNNQNVTGSFTEGARVVILDDPGQGYSSDPYQQIRVDVFAPPSVGSVGLESGRNYLNRAPVNNLDLSLQKSFPIFGNGRAVRFRIDAFNALNHTQFNNVNSTIQFRSLTDPTPVNLPYDDKGQLLRTNGFGTVATVRPPRIVQLLLRFDF